MERNIFEKNELNDARVTLAAFREFVGNVRCLLTTGMQFELFMIF
jgi:hypothetical protein